MLYGGKMSPKKLLEQIATQMEDLEKRGLQESNEYEKLSDDWQSLALDLVEVDILGEG